MNTATQHQSNMKEELKCDDHKSTRKHEREENELASSVSATRDGLAVHENLLENESSGCVAKPEESNQKIVGDTRLPDRKRKKACRYRVSFGEDLIIPVKAYVEGHNDAEILALHHNDIWYTNKDYANFLQDRIDTIRVYRSVNGNMKSLSKYYTIRGLEHYLRYQSHQGFHLEQRSLISAILNEQKIQKSSKSHLCHSHHAHLLHERSRSLTASALDRALQLAAIDAEHVHHDETEDETDEDSSCSDNDSCGDAHEEISVTVPRLSHSPMSLCSTYQLPQLTSRRNWYPNVSGFMNPTTQTDSHSKLSSASSITAPVTESTGRSSDEEIAKALQAVDKELQLWNDLQRTHHFRRDSLCAPSSSSSSSTFSLSTSQMSKNNMPQLYHAPLYLSQYPIISVPLKHATTATTRVSSVRRDSLAGLQHSCNSGL